MNSILFIAAIVVLLAALIIFYQKKRFLHSAVLVQGEVVALAEVYQQRETVEHIAEMYYAPVFEFTTHTGECARVTSSVANKSSAYTVGQQLSIRYAPDNPEQALIDNFWGRWSLVFALCVMGGALLLAAILVGNQ